MENIVQVAGIIDSKEAELCFANGADWIGFPLRLPSGKDDISEADAKAIIKTLKAPQRAVLISYMTTAAEVSQFCDELGLDAVQLHGDISMEELAKLRQMRPDLYLLKSLVVSADNLPALRQLIDDSAEYIDMYITDTFDPKTGAKGATGMTHDWNVSAELVRHSPKPLMMAGGLSPDNVYDAIMQVRPAAVDAHSLLEGADKRKNAEKMRVFSAEAKRAFSEMSVLAAQ
ncbi:phosphoribosylanthranilate isomerase [Epibacterium ulvae]|uniref:phosphoribosylanthranilate isomerase n=1 Tax=Epibacterium ulvae TaxID=1156985 RepID=UPI002492A5FC|nr:phosphoribosylanthranilate isomerase [Epibacterium ulvae]